MIEFKVFLCSKDSIETLTQNGLKTLELLCALPYFLTHFHFILEILEKSTVQCLNPFPRNDLKIEFETLSERVKWTALNPSKFIAL